MSANTSIEWTDATWNPTRGCSMAKGSEKGGCLNCYAARFASRFGNVPGHAFEGFARILDSGPRWTNRVEPVEKHLFDPLHWREPKKIFVDSMSDLFHEDLPDEVIDRVFAVMRISSRHTFQILTKRPERMLRWFSGDGRPRCDAVYNRSYAMTMVHGGYVQARWPLPNVWLGVSVENQETADMRIPLLLQTPAAVRFVSYEPALGPIDFTRLNVRAALPYSGSLYLDALRGSGYKPSPLTGLPIELESDRLDWIIIGGESGPGARPFDVRWAINTVRQCRDAKVPCFVKQMGSLPIIPAARQNHYEWGEGNFDYFNGSNDVWRIKLRDKKGGNIDEWADHLRVRDFPEVPRA